MTGVEDSSNPDIWFSHSDWDEEASFKSPEKANFESGPPPQKGLARKAGLAALAASVTILPNLFSDRSHVHAETPTVSPKPFPYDRYQLNLLTTCAPVSNQEIQEIDSVLSQPPNARVEEMARRTPQYENYQNQPGFRELAQREADRLGLTLIDERPYRQRLDQIDLVYPNQNVIGEGFKVINDFTRNYGFDVSVLKSTESQIDAPVPFKPQDLPNYYFDGVFNYLLDTFRYLPVEEVKASGIKHIVIVRAFKTDGKIDWNVGGEVQFNDPNTVYIGIAELGSEEGPQIVIFHEMSHTGDFNYCHSPQLSQNDPQYEDLNPSNFQYQGKKYKTFDGWRAVTDTQYGAQNIWEDKADTGKYLLPGINRVVALKSPKAIRKKYDVLAARLEKQAPGVVEYLEEISP